MVEAGELSVCYWDVWKHLSFKPIAPLTYLYLFQGKLGSVVGEHDGT